MLKKKEFNTTTNSLTNWEWYFRTIYNGIEFKACVEKETDWFISDRQKLNTVA